MMNDTPNFCGGGNRKLFRYQSTESVPPIFLRDVITKRICIWRKNNRNARHGNPSQLISTIRVRVAKFGR